VSGGGGGVIPTPVVSGIQPAAGPASGGTAVTITGSRFTGATAVSFGGTPAASFTVTLDTLIAAVSPAGAGTVDVTVVTPYGTSAASPADHFTYGVAASQTAPQFSDVPASYWARAAIAALAGHGVVDGFPDGTFRPDTAVTRAQFIKMLDLTLGLSVSPAGASAFTDVPVSAWYAPYVAAAVRAGIVQGTSPTAFSPGAALTREQMALMLARALTLTKTGPLAFPDDAAIDAWALQGLQEAVAAGYIGGFPDGSLRPLATATRAQAAKVLALALAARAGAPARTGSSPADAGG